MNVAMNESNHYQSPDAQEPEFLKQRKYRRTLLYLKRMHDDPTDYRRRLNMRSVLYFLAAVACLLFLQFYSSLDLDLAGIVCLVVFCMFMHLSQLCRLARSSLELNMAIIDWNKVESLLEDPGSEEQA